MKTTTILTLLGGIGILWYLSTKSKPTVIASNAVAGTRG